jgi:disulfide bond formation protein DsbB
MSQERAFLENLLGQRFNFFLVFFGFVLNGSISAKTQVYLSTILVIGSFVCWSLALTLRRSQQKLDIILEDLFTDETHPATIVNERCDKTGSRGKRKIIGYWIPTVCCVILTIGAALAVFGILTVNK